MKYYRDLNNVVNTSREEGRQEERLRLLERQRQMLSRMLSWQLGNLSEDTQAQINQLSLEALEALGEALFELTDEVALQAWLSRHRDVNGLSLEEMTDEV